MKRRTFLAGIGVGTTTIAGCSGNDNSDEWTNPRTCDLPRFYYRYLPEEAKTEVDAAFSEGEYETEGNLYYEMLLEQPQEQALVKDHTYYVADIEAVSRERTVLSFEETTPTLDQPVTFSIRNMLDEQVDFEFTLEYSSGGVVDHVGSPRLFRHSVSLDQGEEYSADVLDKLTEYEISFYFEAREDGKEQFSLDRTTIAEVTIDEDRISITFGGADGSRRCPWAPSGV